MTKIITHCLVKNEERFIWYALNSVLPYTDKILVWDTGSTDQTIEIIKKIKSEKIEFKEYGPVSAAEYPQVRQAMLDATSKEYTWALILDGDEVWPQVSIKTVTEYAGTHPEMESIVVRTHNLVGDIHHRLPESAGQYHLAGQKGHLALRLINLKKIPGLHVNLPHGQIGYFDGQDRLVQNRNPKKIAYLPVHYAHATHLRRSSADSQTLKRAFKYKFELGIPIPNAEVPEIFFESAPVPRVTQDAPIWFWLIALILTPIKKLRRLLLPIKTGY